MSVLRKNVSFALSGLANHRIAFPLISLQAGRFPGRVRGDETLVVEGFARSGNSFFHNVLLLWNPGLKTAHHCHLFSNVYQALRLGIPSVVLIREPAQSVASMVVWDGKLNPTIGLLGWLSFYGQLLKVASDVLILRFEDVIEQPDRCVSGINERFGISLVKRSFSDAERALVHERLRILDERTQKGVFNASLPNSQKAKRKSQVLDSLAGSSILRKADRLHARILDLAV